jgi:hypothetical protein
MDNLREHRLPLDQIWKRFVSGHLAPAALFVASCVPAAAQPSRNVSTTGAAAAVPAGASPQDPVPVGKPRICTVCDTHRVYAGTGLVSNLEPPRGAMGFYFGSSLETVARACANIGGQWDPAAWYPPQAHACVATIPALGVRANVNFDFQSDRMISIDAKWDSSPTAAIAELNRIGEVLWETYGAPGIIGGDVPAECTELITCIEENKVNLGLEWQFKGPYTVDLSVTAPNHKPALHLIYFTPDEINKFKINGL